MKRLTSSFCHTINIKGAIVGDQMCMIIITIYVLNILINPRDGFCATMCWPEAVFRNKARSASAKGVVRHCFIVMLKHRLRRRALLHSISARQMKSIWWPKPHPKTATLDILSLSFFSHEKGFLLIAKSLVELSRRHPASIKIDVNDLLPTPPNVCHSIIQMASSFREQFKSTDLKLVKRCGGGNLCDCIKIEVSGQKHYYFVVHSIDISAENPISKTRTLRIRKLLLLIALWTGLEATQSIREMIDKFLHALGTSIERLKSSFSFLTYCDAMMPAIIEASVS